MEYSKYDEHSQSPGFLLWQVSSAWRRKIAAALAEYDLTHTQYVILSVAFYLNQGAGSVTQKAISSFSMLDTMSVSKSIRPLEKRGLITRVDDKTDSRAKNVALTDAGKAMLRKVMPVVEAVDGKFFDIPEDEVSSALALFSTLLQKNTDMPQADSAADR